MVLQEEECTLAFSLLPSHLFNANTIMRKQQSSVIHSLGENNFLVEDKLSQRLLKALSVFVDAE